MVFAVTPQLNTYTASTKINFCQRFLLITLNDYFISYTLVVTGFAF